MTQHEYGLIVDKQPKKWPEQFITGGQIKGLANSPADWVVNEIIHGPGEDPEIADGQAVDLALVDPPAGIKRFITRKPTTSPGS